jgi:hypothetical protein
VEVLPVRQTRAGSSALVRNWVVEAVGVVEAAADPHQIAWRCVLFTRINDGVRAAVTGPGQASNRLQRPHQAAGAHQSLIESQIWRPRAMNWCVLFVGSELACVLLQLAGSCTVLRESQ